MKKLWSLIKACMTDNMSLFKIKKKDKTKKNGKILTAILCIILGVSIYSYADRFMVMLVMQNSEHVLLSLFTFLVTVLIIVEGIYKAGSLIFNCKDDDLLLSLPIKKSTVVFIRLLKFYVFELLYSTLFLLPSMVAYVTHTSVTATFYVVSMVAIFLIPIIPIAISSFIGAIISATSLKFKHKNIVQIVISMLALLGALYVSFNMQGMINNIGNNAGIIESFISKVYYPAYLYSKLATNFNVSDFIIFIAINVTVSLITIFVISKIYFKINTGLKKVQECSKKRAYRIKVCKPQVALIKKELKKAFNTPVLITNAIFGMVLFVVACVVIAIKFDALLAIPQESMPFTTEQLNENVPTILFMLITFGALTSSITSSMISLEGKSFIVLKSVPVKPYTIMMSKVYTAVLIMMPFVFIGDLIFYVRFNFNLIEIILTLVASIVMPFIAELIGILVNLRYPEMNATADAEVVKQSSSSNICALIGIIAVFITAVLLTSIVGMGCKAIWAMLIADIAHSFILVLLIKRTKGKGVERFNKIDV